MYQILLQSIMQQDSETWSMKEDNLLTQCIHQFMYSTPSSSQLTLMYTGMPLQKNPIENYRKNTVGFSLKYTIGLVTIVFTEVIYSILQ